MPSKYTVHVTFPNGFKRVYETPAEYLKEFGESVGTQKYATRAFSHTRLERVEIFDQTGPLMLVSAKGHQILNFN